MTPQPNLNRDIHINLEAPTHSQRLHRPALEVDAPQY